MLKDMAKSEENEPQRLPESKELGYKSKPNDHTSTGRQRG